LTRIKFDFCASGGCEQLFVSDITLMNALLLQELLEMWKNEEGLRRSELVRDRDDRYQAFLDLEKNLKDHPGFRNNKTGCCYDIFTHKCDEGHEGQKLIYKDEMRK